MECLGFFDRLYTLVVQERCWPKLVSIRLPDECLYYDEIEKEQILSKFLQQCPNPLRQWSIPNTWLGQNAWPSLQRHFKKLEILELKTLEKDS